MEYRGFERSVGRIPVEHWRITPGAGALSPRPWAIRVESDGLAVLEDEAGTVLSYTVKQGEYLLFAPVRVLAGTTATLYGLR